MQRIIESTVFSDNDKSIIEYSNIWEEVYILQKNWGTYVDLSGSLLKKAREQLDQLTIQ